MTVAKWAVAVKERDGYKCRVCGSSERLNAHHIKYKAKVPEKATEIDNGITLCRSCHRIAHKGVYGVGGIIQDLHLFTPERIKQVEDVINRAITETMERDKGEE